MYFVFLHLGTYCKVVSLVYVQFIEEILPVCFKNVFLLYKFCGCVLRVCDPLSYELLRVVVELGIYIYICIMFSSI